MECSQRCPICGSSLVDYLVGIYGHKKPLYHRDNSNDAQDLESVKVFELQDKQGAEQLLQQIGQTADALHNLAATFGLLNAVIDLITKHKCNTNCKNHHGHTPLSS